VDGDGARSRATIRILNLIVYEPGQIAEHAAVSKVSPVYRVSVGVVPPEPESVTLPVEEPKHARCFEN